MTFPPVDRREPFLIRNPHTGRAEAGFLTPGPCDQLHLEGPDFTYWQCPTCKALNLPQKRSRTTRRLLASKARMLNLFYPDKETR
jgi:hypothetical protein